jgi:hypothetical protein
MDKPLQIIIPLTSIKLSFQVWNEQRNPPADEYNIPGYNLVSLKASLLHWTEAPVTMIFFTPVNVFISEVV